MPRRPLGQHFLIDRSVAQRILQVLEINSHDAVLEIGPGKGALTGPLAHHAGKLLLIEKDPRLTEEVRERLADRNNVILRCEDFLKTSWDTIESELGKKIKVVSNLPYQTATAILVKLLTHLAPGTLLSLMFQKEVGDRLLAQPHSKDYGSLTVFANLFARLKLIKVISPKAFRPPPQVYSSLIKLEMREQPLVSPEELTSFEGLLQAGFIHRRKMLRQNLRSYFQGMTASEVEKKLRAVQASPQARAEELSVGQWVNLFQQEGGSRGN